MNMPTSIASVEAARNVVRPTATNISVIPRSSRCSRRKRSSITAPVLKPGPPEGGPLRSIGLARSCGSRLHVVEPLFGFLNGLLPLALGLGLFLRFFGCALRGGGVFSRLLLLELEKLFRLLTRAARVDLGLLGCRLLRFGIQLGLRFRLCLLVLASALGCLALVRRKGTRDWRGDRRRRGRHHGRRNDRIGTRQADARARRRERWRRRRQRPVL